MNAAQKFTIAAIACLLMLSIFIKRRIYRECRAFRHSVFYCLVGK